MIKLLHCGDLHLDSPFSGLDLAKSEAAREEQRELFRSLVCLAKNRRVDLLLIAGDLFDSGFTSSATVKFVSDMLATLSCPVIIAPGNHDPYSENGLYSASFPSNVYIFKSEKLSSFYFDKINVAVHGYAFTSARHEESPLDGELSLDPTKVNILCAHTDLDVPLSPYAPITSRQLSASGFDYAALGHVHNAPDIATFGKTVTAYSGCLQGRSFDELGFGGTIAVEIEGSRVTCEKVVLAKRRYMTETIDVTGASSDADVIAMLRERIVFGNYKEETALRVTLTGLLSPSYTPSPAAIADGTKGLYKLEVRDETTPLLDYEELEKDMTIRGEYYRLLVEKMKNGSAEERANAAAALRIGLCALDGKPIIL